MTSQTKQYIELSDILELRIECGSCNVSISLPLDEKVNIEKLGYCPHCETWWASTPPEAGVTMIPAIQNYVESLKALKRCFEPESRFAGRFAFLLEIAQNGPSK